MGNIIRGSSTTVTGFSSGGTPTRGGSSTQEQTTDSSNQPGWGAVKGDAPAPTTYGHSSGIYRDARGNLITRDQAMRLGRIDSPDTFSKQAAKIGLSASTSQIEQRYAREDIAKQQKQEGYLSDVEIQQARKLLESETAQFAGRTQEQKDALRQALYEQVVYREPKVKPAEVYRPDPKQELVKAIAGQKIYEKSGLSKNYLEEIIPKSKEPEQKFFYVQEGRIRQKYAYNMFSIDEMTGKIRETHAKSFKNIFGGQEVPIEPGKLYTRDIFGSTRKGVIIGSVPKGKTESYPGEAEHLQKMYEIGLLLTPPGVLSSTTAVLKGTRFVGGLKALSPVPKIQRSVIRTTGQIEKSLFEISKNNKNMLAFLRDEKAIADINRRARDIPINYMGKTARQLAEERGEVLKRSIQFGKTFTEPTGTGVISKSGRQQLVSIVEQKQIPVTQMKQVAIQTQAQIHKNLLISMQLQKTGMSLLSIQKQKQSVSSIDVQKQLAPTKFIKVIDQYNISKLSVPQIQKMKSIFVQTQKNILKSKQVSIQKQIQKQIQKSTTKQVSVTKLVSKQKPVIILKPTTFEAQLNKYIRDRKKRKYVWGINNPVPTLKSLTG